MTAAPSNSAAIGTDLDAHRARDLSVVTAGDGCTRQTGGHIIDALKERPDFLARVMNDEIWVNVDLRVEIGD